MNNLTCCEAILSWKQVAFLPNFDKYNNEIIDILHETFQLTILDELYEVVNIVKKYEYKYNIENNLKKISNLFNNKNFKRALYKANFLNNFLKIKKEKAQIKYENLTNHCSTDKYYNEFLNYCSYWCLYNASCKLLDHLNELIKITIIYSSKKMIIYDNKYKCYKDYMN